MSRSTDPAHFFQTSHSLAETSRKAIKSRNNNGSPMRLQSKILAIIADPFDNQAVYVAESAGTARRILLDDPARITHTYRGSTTPLPALALQDSLSSPSHDLLLFAGSWDKSIWSWSAETCKSSLRYIGHTDFVTALQCLTLNSTSLLVSGSSDTKIIIWDITTGEKLHTLQGSHTRGITSLAIDPSTYPPDPDYEPKPISIFSASSDRTIRRWNLQQNFSAVSEFDLDHPLTPHETSIYALQFSPAENGLTADLWTASADGTAKCLSSEQGWDVDTTLTHNDYVRAVALSPYHNLVITAGRDENVKVWDRDSGELVHTYEGHFEEVTGLAVVGKGKIVVSVSIDATVRKWSLQADDLAKAAKEAEEAREGKEKVEDEGASGKVKGVGLTEEEERELEELMDDE